MSLDILSIGASRNIGYLSSIRFLGEYVLFCDICSIFIRTSLDAGATVTFLLRTPSVFDEDATIQKYIKSGKAQLLKGDALVESDVKRAWGEAAKYQSVDLLIFTVGMP